MLVGFRLRDARLGHWLWLPLGEDESASRKPILYDEETRHRLHFTKMRVADVFRNADWLESKRLSTWYGDWSTINIFYCEQTITYNPDPEA